MVSISKANWSKMFQFPEGPKIELNTFQDLPAGLKFSSEIKNFKRATHQSPFSLWGMLKVEIENFKRDSKFKRD